MKSFEEKLQSYAELTVQVGVNIQPGQVLLVKAEVGSAPFVRLVVKEAYRVGAKEVFVDYTDDKISRIKYEAAPSEIFTTFPEWEKHKYESLTTMDAAFLSILSSDPDLLSGVESSRIANYQKAQANALMNWRGAMQSSKNSWSIVAVPSLAWAEKVFPEDNDCVDKLWEAIFAACRVGEKDPVAAWKAHDENLHKRVDYLNQKKYRQLHYRSKGTDLTVGLDPKHLWCGAGSTNHHDVPYMANMPTEEVFTVPSRNEVNGTVASTKPLSYAGNVIDHFSFVFENGRIVDVKAQQGEEVLKNLVATDEGAHYLGEAALVPFRSPISDTNLLFYLTLFDENASNHLAIGNGYAFNIDGGKTMTREELNEAGVNNSLTHVDFMIGSEAMDIDGILADGTREAIFRNGNWAF